LFHVSNEIFINALNISLISNAVAINLARLLGCVRYTVILSVLFSGYSVPRLDLGALSSRQEAPSHKVVVNHSDNPPPHTPNTAVR